MTRYLIRRLFGALVVMWAVATLVFFVLRAVPGDPLRAMLFDVSDPAAAAELRVKYGLDKPIYVQYVKWGEAVVRGDLGSSIYGSREPVAKVLSEAVPRTLSLAGLSFLLAIVIALPAGLVSALRKHSAADHAVTAVAFLGLSLPNFWIGIVLIIIFAAKLHWLPAIGYAPLSAGLWPWLSHLILPAIATGTAFAAIIARMVRSAMLEVLRADYMQVARSKGLPERRLILVHALPNALVPVVTVMGIALALLMAGTVVIENVFSIFGLGRVLIQGILNRDYPMVQGAILVVSGIFIAANLLVDVLYTIIDPRITYQ